MTSRSDLKLNWATHEAARYACEHYHYSRVMPASKLVKIGVWEDNAFIGVVMYGSGATPNLAKPYGLTQTTCCELVRIALKHHRTPVSRIMAISLKFLRKSNPGLRLVVSFADPAEQHHGGIYQANGWLYAGRSADAKFFHIKGEEWHPRSVGARGWVQSIEWIQRNVDSSARVILKPGKHRYLMPLCDDVRKRIQPLALPYPKRARSAEGGTPDDQSGGGGSTPTLALP